jgi:hypothetical protein
LEKENYSRGPLFRIKQIELEIDSVKLLCFEIKARQIEQASALGNGDVLTNSVKQRTRPARERASIAINHLYGGRPPGQAVLPNDTLCQEVNKHLEKVKLGKASDTTILRAAGRRPK